MVGVFPKMTTAINNLLDTMLRYLIAFDTGTKVTESYHCFLLLLFSYVFPSLVLGTLIYSLEFLS